MADLKESGSAGPGKRMQALVDRFKKDKKTYYDGGNEVEGYHDAASKKTVKEGPKKRVVKETIINDDTPYSGRKGQHGDVKGGKQTLTKTKTVTKDNKEVTKTKEKAISNRRAKKMKEKIRKKDPSNKTRQSSGWAYGDYKYD